MIALLAIGAISATAEASIHRNFNVAKNMIELCEVRNLYTNSTYETRECMLGKDDSDGGFKVDHFETNGVEESPIFFKNDLSLYRCNKFGYRRAFYTKTPLKNKSKVLAYLGTSDDGWADTSDPHSVNEISNLKCLKLHMH